MIVPHCMNWLLVLIVCSGAAIDSSASWRKARPQRARSVGRFRLEIHPAHVIEDRAIEVLWRAAITSTNRSRKPRVLPVLAMRATVAARRRTYLATIYLDGSPAELNPDDVALAWIEFVLPAGVRPMSASITRLSGPRTPQQLRLGLRATLDVAREAALLNVAG